MGAVLGNIINPIKNNCGTCAVLLNTECVPGAQMRAEAIMHRKHFKVERHNESEWRVVNSSFGHGLVYPSRAQAGDSCLKLNAAWGSWARMGKRMIAKHDAKNP